MAFDPQLFERNLIDGEWRFPKAPYDYEVRSPATSEVTGTVPLSSQVDVAHAVAAARSAGPAWSDPERRRVVRSAFEASVRTNSFDLAELQATETGLAAADASALVLGCLSVVQSLDPAASEPPAAERSVAEGTPAEGSVVEGQVLGPGFSALEFALSVLGPLFAGARLVVKPSLRAPLTAVALTQLLVESGLPKGALNLVQGLGTDVGAALVSDPGIESIVLRGSYSTVSRAAARAGRRQLPVAASSGAEQALVVGSEADIEQAASIVSAGLRANTAGGPLGIDRILVNERVRDELVDACWATLDGLDQAPLATDADRRAVRAAVDAAVEAGAVPLAGVAEPPDDARHRMGWYLPPLLLGAPPNGAPLGPIGGPIAVVETWRDPGRVDVGAGNLGVVVGLDPAALTSSPGATLAADDPNELVCAGSVATGWLNRPREEAVA